MKVWKITTQQNTTHGGTEWAVGVPRTTDGQGELCGPGWLHFYGHPLLAVLLNPIHANISVPKLWEAEASGDIVWDKGVKGGSTRLVLVKEVPLPVITLPQRVAFAKDCAAWAKTAAVGPRLTAQRILGELSRIAEGAVK